MSSQTLAAVRRFGIVALLSLVVAFSADAAEVGDMVSFKFGTREFKGKVVKVRGDGRFYDVEVTENGRRRRMSVIGSQVTVINPTPTQPTPVQPSGAMPSTGTAGAGRRTWKDASGKFEIAATLQSHDANNVTLLKSDGRTINVPVDKLSPADQAYLASLDQESDPENPFAGGTMSPGATSPSIPSTNLGSAVPMGGTVRLPTATSIPHSTALAPVKMPAASGFSPDPSTVTLSGVKPGPLKLSKKAIDGMSVSVPLIANQDGSIIVFGAMNGRRDDNPNTQIALLQRESGRVVNGLKIDGHRVWFSTADPTTGTILGMVNAKGSDKPHAVCVVGGLLESTPRLIAHWQLFPKDPKKEDYVRYRKLLPNGIALLTYSGNTRAYDYANGREVWSTPSSMFNEPAVSPGGKYAAIAEKSDCAIIETATGKQVASIPLGSSGARSLGFSKDGARLAVATGSRVQIFDIASGQEQFNHESTVGFSFHGKPVMWLDNDRYLLTPSGHLISIAKDLVVWQYRMSPEALEMTDLEHHEATIMNTFDNYAWITLPHPTAANAENRDTSNIAAVKAGDALSVSVTGSTQGVNPNEIRQWLGDAIRRAGYREGNSNSQLVVSITRGKPETETYRLFGRGTESVTFTPVTTKVELKQAGKTIWQSSRRTGMPHFISGNKSLQEYANDASKPNASFIKDIKFPKTILKSEFQSGFGSSVVTAQGIRDM